LKFTRGDTVVAFEKMWFLQKKHALRYASLTSDNHSSIPKHDLEILAGKPVTERLEKLIREGRNLESYSSLPEQQQKQLVSVLVKADAQNYTSANEFIDRNMSFFQTPTADMLHDGRAKIVEAAKFLPDTYQFDSFHSRLYQFEHIDVAEWKMEKLRFCTKNVIQVSVEESDESIIEACAMAETSLSKLWTTFVHGYMRWAISAGLPGPDSTLTMNLLGKEETLRRLRLAKDRLPSSLKS
jgi:glutamyl-tRNA synthetase